MRAAVTESAIGGGGVAFLLLLAMHALLKLRGFVTVTGGALRLGDIGPMWIALVLVVTGIARQAGVSALGEFGCLFGMAGSALRGEQRSAGSETNQQPKQRRAKSGQTSTTGFHRQDPFGVTIDFFLFSEWPARRERASGGRRRARRGRNPCPWPLRLRPPPATDRHPACTARHAAFRRNRRWTAPSKRRTLRREWPSHSR